MEATIKQIIAAQGSLVLLMGAKLPVKAAYAVSKLATACAKELEDYNAKRTSIFKSGGCTSGTVNGREEWVHPDGTEKRDEIVKEADELLEVKTVIVALPLDLEQFKDVEIPGGAFFALDWAMKSD